MAGGDRWDRECACNPAANFRLRGRVSSGETLEVLGTVHVHQDPRVVHLDGAQVGFVLPHHEHSLYVCDDIGLSPATRLVFEKEAGEFAADLLFLGDRFALDWLELDARSTPGCLRMRLVGRGA